MNHIAHAENPKLLWTCREAAAALSVSERTLWTLTDQGKIPCLRIGRSVRYDPGDIRSWIEAQKTASSDSGKNGEENS
jgi:excisionase family DNA binding protein